MNFQKDFNVAISALLESGIYQKIEAEIKNVNPYGENKIRRWYYLDVFWVPEKLKSNKPFTIDHSIPAFIVLGFGLPSASMIFIVELIIQLFHKNIPGKRLIQETKDQEMQVVATPKSREPESISHENVEDLQSDVCQCKGKNDMVNSADHNIIELEDLK